MRTPVGQIQLSDDIDKAQIERLAKTLIIRSADELCQFADSNPELVREWVAELRQRREGLEAEVQALDTALYRLLAIRGRRGLNAA